jgi:hypothetical protein
MDAGVSKNKILIFFLNFNEYSERKLLMNSAMKFVPPGHFYSPLPNLNDVKELYQLRYQKALLE